MNFAAHHVVDNGLGVFATVFDEDFFGKNTRQHRAAHVQPGYVGLERSTVVLRNLGFRVKRNPTSFQQVRVGGIAGQNQDKIGGDVMNLARFQVVNLHRIRVDLGDATAKNSFDFAFFYPIFHIGNKPVFHRRPEIVAPVHHCNVYVVPIQFEGRFDRRVRRADDDHLCEREFKRFIVVVRHLRAVFAGNTQRAWLIEVARGQNNFVGVKNVAFSSQDPEYIALLLYTLYFSEHLGFQVVIGGYFPVVLKGFVAVGLHARHRKRNAANLNVFGR